MVLTYLHLLDPADLPLEKPFIYWPVESHSGLRLDSSGYMPCPVFLIHRCSDVYQLSKHSSLYLDTVAK